MSDVENSSRSRPNMRSRVASRDSSKASYVSPTCSEDIASAKSEFRGILKKSAKSKNSDKKSKSRSRSRSPATSLSSVASSEMEKGFETAEEDVSDADGLAPILKNLHHGTHVALTDKSNDVKIHADKLIKSDASKNLSDAIRKERLKGAQMFAELLNRPSAAEEPDIPQFKPFNKKTGFRPVS
jgi:hypothetical protein